MPEIFKMMVQDRHRVILVANKLDSLPKGFKLDSLQHWVKRQIERHLGEDFEKLEQFNICLTSAKKVTGVSKILTILDKTKG